MKVRSEESVCRGQHSTPMRPSVISRCARLATVLGSFSVWLCVALIVAMSGTVCAQDTGKNAVINSGGTPVPSPSFLDATQFSAGVDPCQAIALAFGSLSSTGGTVDARGVTCSVEQPGVSAGLGLVGERIHTKSATQIGYIVNNPTTGSLNATVDCIAMHD